MMRRRRMRYGPPVQSDRGSLVMVMLVVIVGMGLAALMLPLVLTQTGTTTFDSTRGRALQAAESGIDLAIGQIRAAGRDDPTGASLPCGSWPAKVPLGATPADGTYSLQIDYYAADPDITGVAVLNCPPLKPRFAKITATGYAPNEARSRKLAQTYVLAIADKQTSGSADTEKAIWFYANGQKYCMTYIGGNQLAFDAELCGSKDISAQSYTYSNLTDNNHTGFLIRLADNSCLYLNGNSDHFVSNGCLGETDNLDFYVTLTGLLEGYKHTKCPNASQPPSDGSPGTISNYECSTLEQTPSLVQPWIMGSRMGIRVSSGQLVGGQPSTQVINGWQYSRCLTVQPDAPADNLDGVNLVAYSCAQQHDGTAPWQQAFSFTRPSPATTPPTTTQLKVCAGDGCAGGVKCVVSPGVAGGLVSLAPCDLANSSQTWTNGDNYSFVDDKGLCLSLDLYGPVYEEDYAKVITEQCHANDDVQAWAVPVSWADPNSHTGQKPPPEQGSPPGFKDLHEK